MSTSYRPSYFVSLWNYIYYKVPEDLGGVVEEITSNGYGVELWADFASLDPYRPVHSGQAMKMPDAGDLFRPEYRQVLKGVLKGAPSCWHGRGTSERPLRNPDFQAHREQIDTAAFLGSSVISVHEIGEGFTTDLFTGEDPDLPRRVLDYAQEKGVNVAIETGNFAAIARACDRFPNLKVCLDPYNIRFAQKRPLRDYVEAFRDRICDLHLYDGSADLRVSHLAPGKGEVPEEDWRYLLSALEEMRFQGPAVLEVVLVNRGGPETPLQTIAQAVDYLQGLR